MTKVNKSSTSPLVSIVVPTYNHGRYLAQCIDSLLAQSYFPIEIIVVDDGSTDDTAEVLDRYNGRITCISQGNAGQSAALNRGWSASSGDILSYLSADDILYKDAVCHAVKELNSYQDAVVVYPDFHLVDEASRVFRRVCAPSFDFDELFFAFVCQPGPGAFFRRSAWSAAGGWQTQYRQNPDLDFWLRMALQGDFRRIPLLLAAFRVHRASQTFQLADEIRADEPIAIAKCFIERPDLPDVLQMNKSKILCAGYLLSAQLHLNAGRFGVSLGLFYRLIKIRPSLFLRFRTYRMIGSAIFNRLSVRARLLKSRLK